MKDLEKLIDGICSAEYTWNMDGKTRSSRVCSLYDDDNKRGAIAKAVYEWASEQLTDIEAEKKLAELEAKVYAYEKIIANSNFVPMVQPIIVDEFKGFPDGEKGTE